MNRGIASTTNVATEFRHDSRPGYPLPYDWHNSGTHTRKPTYNELHLFHLKQLEMEEWFLEMQVLLIDQVRKQVETIHPLRHEKKELMLALSNGHLTAKKKSQEADIL